MSIAVNLSVLTLRPVLGGACQAAGYKAGDPNLDVLVAFLSDRFNEHRQVLTTAMQLAQERAWKSLEIALSSESFWERCQTALARSSALAFRQQIRSFLDAMPVAELAGKTQFRRECLRDLQTARQAPILTSGTLDFRELAKKLAAFAPLNDPAKRFEAESLLYQALSNALKAAGYGNLAWLILHPGMQGTPLVVILARFFFRRAVHAHTEIREDMPLAAADGLTRSQDSGLASLAAALDNHSSWVDGLLEELREAGHEATNDELDLRAELDSAEPAIQELGNQVLKLLEPRYLERRALRPTDCLSVSGESERLLVQDVANRARSLTDSTRRQLPALRNAVGKLQVVAGEFETAQREFQEVASLLSDRRAQAETYHNAYQAALERRAWPEALAALQKAAALDPKRFALFPLNKFEAERILGAGGFGVAFLCRNRHSGSRVVVKALRVEGLERDVADLFREARVVEELDHPAIIRLRDCDYTDTARTRPYLVMDYFEGQTLADYVEKNGPLLPHQLLAVAVPVADALKAAHDRGLLHRDVKPANLLVRRDGADWAVKLIDFGLAMTKSVHSAISNSAVRLRTSVGGSLAGTLDYASPEQMGRLKDVEVGPFSDVYSFGKTCYFALLGTPEPDDEEKENLPAAWRKLLSQCTARTVAKRLPNFTAVLERLALIQGEQNKQETSAPPPAEEPSPAAEHEPYQDSSIQSIIECTQAIRANPKNVDAYFNRGVAYTNRGDFDLAIADFTKAIRLDPTDPFAYANRGTAYRSKGKHEQAIHDFTEALRLDPTYSRALLYRGGTFEETGAYEDAIVDYIEAIKADPKSADAYNALTWLWATCPEEDVRDGPRAVEYATSACEMTEWGDPNVLDTLAAAYAECGQFEEAVQVQQKAVELAPDERNAEFQGRIKLYQAGTPYREKAVSVRST